MSNTIDKEELKKMLEPIIQGLSASITVDMLIGYKIDNINERFGLQLPTVEDTMKVHAETMDKVANEQRRETEAQVQGETSIN